LIKLYFKDASVGVEGVDFVFWIVFVIKYFVSGVKGFVILFIFFLILESVGKVFQNLILFHLILLVRDLKLFDDLFFNFLQVILSGYLCIFPVISAKYVSVAPKNIDVEQFIKSF